DRSSIGQSQRVSNGHDRNVIAADQINGALGGGLGGPTGTGAGTQGGRGGRTLPSISGSVSKSGTQQDQLQHSTGQTNSTDSSNTASSGVRDEHSNGTGASSSDGTYSRSGVFSRASQTSSA